MTLSIGASAFVEPGQNPDTGTTPAQTTQATGSTFLVITVSESGAIPTVTDNKGNTYNTSFAAISYKGTVYGDTFYVTYAICENGVGGTGHTTTTTFSTSGHGHGFGSVYFIELKSSVSYPTLDVEASANDSATPYTGSITTATANSLVLAFCGSDQTATTTKTVASPFTKFVEDTNGGNVYIGAAAWAAVATAGTAQGVSWTATNSLDTINLLLAFKEHTTSGSTIGTAAATVGAATASGVASATATGATAATVSPATAAASGTGSGTSGSSAVGAATLSRAIGAALASSTAQAAAAATVGHATAAAAAQSGSSSGVPTLGTHTMLVQPDSSGSSPATTSAINTQTSGSAFFCMLGGFAYTHTPTDTFGNTYTQQGTIENWNNQFPNEALKAFVSFGTGGNGHQLSLVKDAAWVSRELTMPFIEIKNAVSCTQVQHYVASGSTNVCPPVTVTGPALLVAIWSGDSAQNGLTMTAVPDSGFSVIESFLVIPNASGCQMAVAVLQVASAGIYGLTWTETPVQGAELAIFAFEGGVVTSTAVVAATVAHASAAAAGQATTQATGAATVAAISAAAAAGSGASSGVGTAALAPVAGAGSGNATATGSGAATASGLTSVGSAAVTAIATAAPTVSPATAQGVAGLGSSVATAAATVSPTVAAAQGFETSSSAGAAQLATPSAQGFAGLAPSLAVGAAHVSPVTAAGVATAITAGAAAAQVSPDTAQGVASLGPIVGAVAAHVQPASAAGSATQTAAGAGAGQLGSALASGVAVAETGATSGSGVALLRSPIAAVMSQNASVASVDAIVASAIAHAAANAGQAPPVGPGRRATFQADNRTARIAASARVARFTD